MQNLAINVKLSLLATAVVAGLSGCVLEGDDGQNGVDGAPGTKGVDGQSGQDGKSLPRELAIEVVGRFAAGGVEIYGKSAAEIVQFHSRSKSAFAVNSATSQIDVINLTSLPMVPVGNAITDTSLSSQAFSYPSSVTVKDADGLNQTLALGIANSIAIYADMLAIAVEAAVKTDVGAVLFYRLDALGQGTFVKAVTADALPDMVVFSPDGKMALVANEGEPDTDFSIDPQGSISKIIITDDIPADVATTINMTTDMVFSSDNLSAEDYDTDAKRKALLQLSGVKFANLAGSTVAQELEPEYITFSADGTKAYVSLQESNAIGIIDTLNNSIEVRGLGFKDWSKFQLDFSNKDEVPNFQSVAGLYGMYQPDTISSYTWNGASFILSANEGDSRDWDAYSEEIRVRDIVDQDKLNMIIHCFAGSIRRQRRT